jgi:hypothetical protein
LLLGLAFLVELTAVFLLASFHFGAALLVLLLPALFELPLLLRPLLVQALARGLPLLFRVLPALLFLRLALGISPLLFRLPTLLIVVVGL